MMLMMMMVQLVVKSQILAGGRGLGTFKNGFQGGVHIVKADKVEETAGTTNLSLSLRKYASSYEGLTVGFILLV